MTYTELKANVAAWLNRSDLTSVIPTFIELAEERLRDLRLHRFTTSTTLTVPAGQDYVALPTDFLELRSLVSGSEDWHNCTPDRLARLTELGTDEKAFSISNGRINLAYAPDADLDLSVSYYASLAALSDSNPSNWVSLNHPGVYLWASLAEAASYVVNDAAEAKFDSKFARSVELLRQQDVIAATGQMFQPSPEGF
jgi:hypothetical protein